MERDQLKTDAIKLAAQAYAIEGYSPLELLQEAAYWLWERYERTADERCRQTAERIIHAYVELGLPHRNPEEMQEKILTKLREKDHTAFEAGYYPKQTIRCRPSEIRKVLRPWTDGRCEDGTIVMPLGQAVSEMIELLRQNRPGQWVFPQPIQKNIFVLVILENGEAYLLDTARRRIYTCVV